MISFANEKKHNTSIYCRLVKQQPTDTMKTWKPQKETGKTLRSKGKNSLSGFMNKLCHETPSLAKVSAMEFALCLT